MENREKLFKQYKSDCTQTIGETDTAFDNDNFIDWLCQQNKQLLDKIERLKLFKVELDNELTKKDKYLEEKERQNHYFNRQVNEIYTKNKVLLDEIELLKFQLKAAYSVNENLSKKIIEIINDSKLDKDAVIKVIVSYLTNQNK